MKNYLLFSLLLTIVLSCKNGGDKRDGGNDHIVDEILDRGRDPINGIDISYDKAHDRGHSDIFYYQCDEDENCVSIREDLLENLLSLREESCGQNSLEMLDPLNRAAQEKANSMAETRNIDSGDRLEDRLSRYGVSYEKIWEYYAGWLTLRQFMDQLTEDQERMNNYILNCEYNEIGIGIAPDTVYTGYYWFDIVLIKP